MIAAVATPSSTRTRREIRSMYRRPAFRLAPGRLRILGCLVGLLALSAPHTSASTQSDQGGPVDRARAIALVEAGRFVEALPLLEHVVEKNPADGVALEKLAMSVVAYAATLEEPDARKRQRVRARQLLAKAKDLGVTSNYLTWGLSNIPEDGGDDTFSTRKDVEEAMRRGEAAFARGDHGAAIEAYTLALSLDPRLYEAALYIGDAYFVRNETESAGRWFKRASEIDPDRETAYRYWGDALKKAGRRDEARDRFIDAIVAEPYRQESRVGLGQWADHFGVDLYLLRVETASKISTEGGKTTITLDSLSLTKKDGSSAWIAYGVIRASWAAGRFKKAFPAEPTYRHSLAEEVEALTSVVENVAKKLASRELKEADLDPQLAYLKQLHADGLLEPYILFAIPDEGIAQDYEGWRKAHREKMREFLLAYVVGGKGIRRQGP
jgi:tetratricopeptide (TPR) repeat protein